MSELRVEPDLDYRPRMNPEFMRRARENMKRRAAQEAFAKAQEAKRQEHARRRERMRVLEPTPVEVYAPQLGTHAEERFQRLIAMLAERNQKTVPQVREIIEVIAAKHGLQRAHILSNSHQRPIVKARHEAMAEARRLRPDMSLTQLGRQFQRDHTTIMAALKKMGMPTASTGASS